MFKNISKLGWSVIITSILSIISFCILTYVASKDSSTGGGANIGLGLLLLPPLLLNIFLVIIWFFLVPKVKPLWLYFVVFGVNIFSFIFSFGIFPGINIFILNIFIVYLVEKNPILLQTSVSKTTSTNTPRYLKTFFGSISKLGLTTIISILTFLILIGSLTVVTLNHNSTSLYDLISLLLFPVVITYAALSVAWLFTIPKPKVWWQYLGVCLPFVCIFILLLIYYILIITQTQIPDTILKTFATIFIFILPILCPFLALFTVAYTELKFSKTRD